MMSIEERRRIIDALSQWAEKAPNEPVFGLLAAAGPAVTPPSSRGNFLTPLELVKAIKSHTQEGNAILEILEHGLRREGIDKVVSRLMMVHA